MYSFFLRARSGMMILACLLLMSGGLMTAPALAVESSKVYGPVQSGETLGKIAAELSLSGQFGRDRLMLALLRHNPHAFSISCNVNALKVGARLSLPSASEIAALDADQASQAIQAQHQAWRAYQRRGEPIVCPPETRVAATEAETSPEMSTSRQVSEEREEQEALAQDSPALTDSPDSNPPPSGEEKTTEASPAGETPPTDIGETGKPSLPEVETTSMSPPPDVLESLPARPETLPVSGEEPPNGDPVPPFQVGGESLNDSWYFIVGGSGLLVLLVLLIIGVSRQIRQTGHIRRGGILWSLIILVAGAILGYQWWQQRNGQENTSLHIALVTPLTGPNSKAGEAHLQGVELYLEKINQQGGIQGRKLVLDVYDDQNDKQLAKQRAGEIVEAGRALAVIGHNYSSASMSAGPVYAEAGIPVISSSSTTPEVTHDNPWYFRTVVNNNLQGRLLANYVKKVMGNERASIIYKTGSSFSEYLARVFAETAAEIGLDISHQWGFDLESPDLEQRLDHIVTELKNRPDAGTVFLATHAPEGVMLVKLIKDARIRNSLITPSSYAGEAFQQGFEDFPQEKASPGFYTEGVLISSPLLFDTANQYAQRFRREYQDRFGQESSWYGAYAYDTALVIGEALKAINPEVGRASIKADRQRLRDYLAGLNNPEQAVEGVTGLNYFDEHGDAFKPVSIGMYRKTEFISSLNQLQVVRNQKDIPNLQEARRSGRVLMIDGIYMHNTHVVYAGLQLNTVSELDFENGTSTLDFHLWFRYSGRVEPDNIQFLNAAEDIKLGEPVTSEVIGQQKYHLYHVRGKFKLDFLNQHSARYALGKHDMGVSFRHRNLPRNELIYVIDVLGMGLNREKDPAQRLRRNTVLSSSHGWNIEQASYFQDTVKTASLGNPGYLHVGNGMIDHSSFNVVVGIGRDGLALRGIVPQELAPVLLLLSLLVLMTSLLALKLGLLRMQSRSFWLFQVSALLLFLLSAEVVSLNWLMYQGYTGYLSNAIRVFDILWWMIPAFLLVRAAEHFIWLPIEEHTGQRVPNVARLFLAFVIYMLAFFGIIAFVFDQKITSLLATSGIIAMVIGLAIQVNIANIFSGLIINIERPFRVGDWIQIGDNPESRVVDITWRSTRLQTRERNILSIPNSIAAESTIYNYHYPDDTYYLWFIVHLEPHYSPDRVKKVLYDALLSMRDMLCDDPPPIRFRLGNWSAQYYLMFRVKDYSRKHSYLNRAQEQAWLHLRRAGMTPAVDRDLYMLKARDDQEKLFREPETILRESKVFEDFPPQVQLSLSKQALTKEFAPREAILREGEASHSLFLITEGVVTVHGRTEDNHQLELGRLSVGDIFGEIGVLEGIPRTGSVTTLTSVEVLEFPGDSLMPLLEKHPEIKRRLQETARIRQQSTSLQLESRRGRKPENTASGGLKAYLGRLFKRNQAGPGDANTGGDGESASPDGGGVT